MLTSIKKNGIINYEIRYWELAQQVEQLAVNQLVIGSNPILPAIYDNVFILLKNKDIGSNPIIIKKNKNKNSMVGYANGKQTVC